MRPITLKRIFFITITLSCLFVATLSWADVEAPVGLVVIDPGHGGIDKGAIGPRGIKEKDLTLKVAKALAVVLREKLGLTVILTREDDTFIPLGERTEVANSRGANLFISIHVNAAKSSRASGIETFFLSYDATDEEAVRLAAVENGFDAAHTGIEYAFNDDLKTTLLDLVETAAHHDSSTLAEAIHTSIIRSTGRGDRGVRQAPFAVLEGAVMPAVLVELGFISNSSDERWLLSKAGRKELAHSIALGVADFQGRRGRGVEKVGYRK